MKKTNQLIVLLGLSVVSISAMADGGPLSFTLGQGGSAPNYTLSNLSVSGEAFPANSLNISGNQIISSRPVDLQMSRSHFSVQVLLPEPYAEGTSEVVGTLTASTTTTKSDQLKVEFNPVKSDYSCSPYSATLSSQGGRTNYIFNPAISCSIDSPVVKSYTYALNVYPFRIVGVSANPQTASLTSNTASWASQLSLTKESDSNYSLAFLTDAANYNAVSGKFSIAVNTKLVSDSGNDEGGLNIPVVISKSSTSGVPALLGTSFSIRINSMQYACRIIPQAATQTGNRTYAVDVITKCSIK